MNYLIEIIIGCAVTLIGYFLKRTMDQLDKTTAQCYKNENNIKILSNTFDLKHESLGKQMEKLTNSLDKLTDKIDTLHEAVHELKYK
jgi:uncharacterized coiled-coil DUF342 family protein